MREEQVDHLLGFSNRFIDITTQYQALTDSARVQYDLMVQSHNARVISRIGFVMQEMKDLESEMIGDIENRRIETNDNDCIDFVEGILQSLVSYNGYESMNIARVLKEEISLINDEMVNPIMKILDVLVSQLEKETISRFRETNAVSQMDSLHDLLEAEVEIADELFETFVQEIFDDFIMFETLTSEINGRTFPQLDAMVENFRKIRVDIEEMLLICTTQDLI